MSTMKIIGIFGLIAVVPGLLGLLRLYFKFGDSAWNTLKRTVLSGCLGRRSRSDHFAELS